LVAELPYNSENNTDAATYHETRPKCIEYPYDNPPTISPGIKEAPIKNKAILKAITTNTKATKRPMIFKIISMIFLFY